MRTWPPPTRHAWTEAFWTVVSVLLGVVAGVAGGISGLTGPWAGAIGIVVIGTLLLSGRQSPEVRVSAYRRWTQMTAWYANMLGFAVRRVSFFCVLRAVSWTGSQLPLTSSAPLHSLWVRRPYEGQSARSYLHEYPAAPGRGSPTRGWAREFCSWALRSGNFWVVCLVPFLAILAVVDEKSERGGAPPVTTYTLY